MIPGASTRRSFFLAILVLALAPAAGRTATHASAGFSDTAAQKLDPRIFAGRAAGESASFLVVMREQADLSGARFLAKKAEKGRFVFEALRALAEQTQKPLRASLDAAGIRYQSFYLVNMVAVAGSRSLALELAARDDVS